MAVVNVHHQLIAYGAFEEMFICFFEGKSFASWRFASVELVAFLVPKPSFKFFKNAMLLVIDEAFHLVGLEPPMKNKPPCFFVAIPSESYQRMVVEFVEYLTHRVEAYLGLVCNLDVCDLVNAFEGLSDSDSVFTIQSDDAS